MYGGGGFEGASQFGGGGFIGSQNDGDARSPAPKSFNIRKEGLRATTLKQLIEANKAEFQDDTNSLHNVTIVGKIISMREISASNLIEMNLFDGTGTYMVHYYVNDDDEATVQRASEWRPGVYVRVHGNLSDFESKWRVQAYHIRAVTDFNEVTYHNLQCILQHMHISKGAPGSGASVQPAGGAMPGRAAPGTAVMGGGDNEIGNDGLTGVQRQVMGVFDQPENLASSEGITVEHVMAQLPHLSAKQVRDATIFLMDNANIYTVSDENHFKSTKVD